uniref:hypothetical protein n=1 Tax=Thermus aquaticus TaxID=271 RepID=UPI001314B799|nr:hypothetical protein [Thermus aquaticus]
MFKESRYTLTAEELGHVFVYPEFGAILKYGRKWVVEHDNPAYDWALTKAQGHILERLKERFKGWKVKVEVLEDRVWISLKGDPDTLVLWKDGGVSGTLLEELTPKSRPWWARFLGR